LQFAQANAQPKIAKELPPLPPKRRISKFFLPRIKKIKNATHNPTHADKKVNGQ